MSENIISSNPKILLQITVDSNNKLGIGSSLKKQPLINLIIDVLKILVNQTENKIIQP